MRTLQLFFLSVFSLSTFVNGLSINFDLVHRDSPLSPLYNSSSTLSELARNARLRSLIRSRRLLLQTDILPTFVIEGVLGEYIMKFYMGSPPVESWAIADTGSDLIWVQCLPCDTCYSQNTPIFDPSKSSTYKIVSCQSNSCTFFPKGWSRCGNSTQCAYSYSYGYGAMTFGDLATDFFSFGGDSVSVLKSPLLFGCGHNNTGIYSSKSSGFVGLGAGNLSLVSQVGPEIGYTFSYCLVPYFSNYTGITVGNKTVEISPKTEGNTLIDSGATWFLMESSFYVQVEALTKEAIGVQEVKNASDLFSLCYSNKSAESIMKNFPDFVVHFKGVDVHLKPDHNLFFSQDDLICLAIIPIEHGSFFFDFDYGNIPQINFQVEYDLAAKQISFAPADCSKM